MLGSEVSRVARESGVEVIDISRSSETSFDVESVDFDFVAAKLELCETDWLVNCIGWIPQKSSGNQSEDQRLAALLNTSLPAQISASKLKRGFHWVQIATDCVFLGDEGGYREGSPKNASDLYGVSKIAGEELSKGAIQIRCSIVGRDSMTRSGIYSWFKWAVANGPVNGFSNHIWNGVSTTAFAKLTIGMLRQDWTMPLNQHWTPEDVVSKYRLLMNFAAGLGVGAGSVLKADSPVRVDRELRTENPDVNKQLWEMAGYAQTPTILELCQEFIMIDRELGFTDEAK
jgi:dTDP-4-dehydrorhamnose reductase|tara:strand:- start:814 stop:1674 length:861 start_codon:yes stop_codon:yes gene_type:complete